MPQASTRQSQQQQQLDIGQSGGARSLLTMAIHKKMTELEKLRRGKMAGPALQTS